MIWKTTLSPGLDSTFSHGASKDAFFSLHCWSLSRSTPLGIIRLSDCQSRTEKRNIYCVLQRRSPGRYQPLQIRTLQRGMRKMRAHLLEIREEQ
jgi:hypothetical protein